VITPSNPHDAKGLLKAAIRDDDPVLFMESERMYGDKGEVPDGEYLLPIGVADIKRPGKDATIVSFGKMMKVALGAAEELAEGRHDCEVIDLRTIRPLDEGAIINSVKKTNRLVVVDENFPYGSIASEISLPRAAPCLRPPGRPGDAGEPGRYAAAFRPEPDRGVAAQHPARGGGGEGGELREGIRNFPHSHCEAFRFWKGRSSL
jgi:hypothetical protein